jgi:hypothetical protein
MHQSMELCQSQPKQASYGYPTQILQLWIKSLNSLTTHQRQQTS